MAAPSDIDVQRIFERFNARPGTAAGRRRRRRLSLFPSVFAQLRTFSVPVDDPSGSDGEADELDTGTLIFDGGVVGEPTIENNGNGKKISGTSEDWAKILFAIEPPPQPVAGHTYTMRYQADFSGLLQQGKLAMVGFGLKDGSKYHGTGLRGDGASGLNAYKVWGSNFSQLKAQSVEDGGAAAHGTQGGANWLQLAIGADGLAYTLRTGTGAEFTSVTWADEFTDAEGPPLASLLDLEFGPFLYLDAADKGPFALDVSLWQQGGLPAQFGAGDWSVADAETGGVITITITTLPDEGSSAITDLEYQIDGGSWVSLGDTAIGAYPVSGLTDDVEVDVALRAANAAGAGPASATKAVTPTTAGPAVEHLDTLIIEATQTTFSWTDQAIGDAHADRLIVLAVSYGSANSNVTVASGSVGGEAITVVVNHANTSGTDRGVAVVAAAVPSGATGTISITMSASCGYCHVDAYRALPASATAIDSGSAVSSSGTDVTVADIDVVNGGFAVGAFARATWFTGETHSASWTGADEPVVDSDDKRSSSGLGQYGAVSMSTTEAVTGDMTVTYSVTASVDRKLAVASWGAPA